MYNRPISPSVIRQIIREELAVAANDTVQFETNPVKDQLTDRSHGSGDSKRSQRNPAEDHDDRAITEDEKQKRRTAMKNAASWMDPAQIEQAEKVEQKRQHHDEMENEPNSLDECVLVSCPLIFGGFSRRSPIRQQCFEIKKNLWWQSFFLCVVISNSLYIALAPELKQETSEEANKQSEGEFWFDVICAGIMGFEVLTGVIAYGFVGSETTYLRNSGFHKLDMICFVVTVLEYVGQHFNMPDMTLRPFRMLRIFKPICKVKSLHGVKSIIVTMSEGAPQLGIIFLFLLLTVAAWTILGMAIFSKSFRKRCVTMDLQVPLCTSDFSTGNFGPTCNFTFDINHTFTVPGGVVAISQSYPFEQWCDIIGFEADYDEVAGDYIPPPTTDIKRSELFEKYKRDDKLEKPGSLDKTGTSWYDSFNAYPKDQYGRWHTCQRNLFLDMNATVTTMCEEFGNPSGGYSHFDNLWGSLCSIAQVVVPDSYYDILWRSIDSEPKVTGATISFYFFINVFDTFLLLGLFVAVVTGTFKRVRESHNQASQFITQEQQNELEDEAFEAKKRDDEDLSGEEAMMNAAQDVVKSERFVLLISATILTQLVAMAVGESSNVPIPYVIRQYSQGEREREGERARERE